MPLHDFEIILRLFLLGLLLGMGGSVLGDDLLEVEIDFVVLFALNLMLFGEVFKMGVRRPVQDKRVDTRRQSNLTVLSVFRLYVWPFSLLICTDIPGHGLPLGSETCP